MNGKDIFFCLKYVGGDLIEEAEYGQFALSRRRTLKRPLLIAALVTAFLLLAGCAAAAAYHWYASYFSQKQEAPLTDNQLAYMEKNIQELEHITQTSQGYTVALQSAIAEGQRACITFLLTAPEGVDLLDFQNPWDQEPLRWGTVFAYPEGVTLPANSSVGYVEDGDGKPNTILVVLEIGPGGILEAMGERVSFEAGSKWRIVFSDILREKYDREYEQELLSTKYAGQTDYIMDGEEAARIHSKTTLVSGKWVFEVALTASDSSPLALLQAPITTKAYVLRNGEENLYEVRQSVENVTITSIVLQPLGATVTLTPPEPAESFSSLFLDMDETFVSREVDLSMFTGFYAVLKDGTEIHFFQSEGALDTAHLKADSPIPLDDVDYLHLADNTIIKR